MESIMPKPFIINRISMKIGFNQIGSVILGILDMFYFWNIQIILRFFYSSNEFNANRTKVHNAQKIYDYFNNTF